MIISPCKYDGHLLHNRFAFDYFGKNVNPLGDIIAFRGEMEVLADAMIDKEDVAAGAFIWSDDAVNFLWEIPVLSQSPFGAVAYQQLLNQRVANILAQPRFLNRPLYMKGDDIMVENEVNGKCSVSITHVTQNAALGHTGVNIQAGNKAPAEAFSTQLSDQQVEQFMRLVIEHFYGLNRDLFTATAKVMSN